ncbi:hypothetical protein M3E74_07085 [Morganella morganii]|uniref:hypothetical protein n=1 Tax=Morganella morganii TaxID=582 RepID=UPI0021A44049|nr:hypothetical protein [Morganella morganii]MCT1587218.1 hypothetical protein [Morganella morganii]
MNNEKKLRSLPTVKSDVKKYLSRHDIYGVLQEIKKEYTSITFDDDDMIDSILAGYNMFIAGESLRRLNVEISSSDVKDICSWLSGRCSYLNRSRKAMSLGITHGIWISSGVCGHRGSDKKHDKFNGKKFSLKDGLSYYGKTYFPGHERYCRCGYKTCEPIND